MFSLILTIIAVVLALILAIVAIYYGGNAFKSGSIKVVAQTLASQSLQISAARALAVAQNRTLPEGVSVSIPTDLLRAMPVPPKGAYASNTPAADDWVYYLPGASGHFGIALKINEAACMEVNRTQGFIGIPAAWDGQTSIQCFGPSDTGYTYLYEPTGTTTEQHTAALDKSVGDAKVTIPDATPGYPRKCPDKTTITTGLCQGGAPPAQVQDGFWLITANTGDYDASLTSGGFALACPDGAIDPTGPNAVTPPSLPGDLFNSDGFVDLVWGSGWDNPPPVTPRSRTWCIPAAESDVTVTGPISTPFSEGEVGNVLQLSTGANIDVESWVWSVNAVTTVTAKGVQWSMVGSTFSVTSENPANYASVEMHGQKLAIGIGPRPSHTFFVNSPVLSSDGFSYQNTQGTVQFDTVLPACTPIPPVPLGTGGRIVSMGKNGHITAILKEDGSVWGTGDSYEEEFGLCEYTAVATWRILATNVQSMTVTNSNIYLVKTGGSLWIAGTVSNGIAGPNQFREFYPDRFVQMVGAGVAYAGGGSNGAGYSAYLDTDGNVWFTGSNRGALAGTGTQGERFRSFIPVQSGVLKLALDVQNMFTVHSDGSLWVTGDSSYYKLGIAPVLHPNNYDHVTPGMAPWKVGDNVVDVAWNSYSTAFVKSDGTVYAAGYNSCGYFGRPGTYQQSFARIANSVGQVTRVWLTDGRLSLLDVNGTLWEAGCDVSVNGNAPIDTTTFTAVLAGVQLYSPGTATHYMDTAGNLFARGANAEFGMYGDGTYDEFDTWVPVAY